MKKSVIFMICLVVTLISFGQIQRELEEVEVTPPKFTGIENVVKVLPESNPDLIFNYLSQKVIYPQRAKSLRKEGTEVVQFVVTPSGKLKDFKVINSVCPEIDFELISVLENTAGMWNPGTNNGEPVAMEAEVSVVFSLGEYKDRTPKEKFTVIASALYAKGTKKMFITENAAKALKYFERAMNYLPNDQAILYSRGMAKYELGDTTGAKEDWERMRILAHRGDVGRNIELVTNNYNTLKGFKVAQSYIKD